MVITVPLPDSHVLLLSAIGAIQIVTWLFFLTLPLLQYLTSVPHKVIYVFALRVAAIFVTLHLDSFSENNVAVKLCRNHIRNCIYDGLQPGYVQSAILLKQRISHILLRIGSKINLRNER